MKRQLPLPLAFNPEHDFAEYCAGGNAEAVGHLRKATRGQGEPFIYLWGADGLGKTHLLHACCREAHRCGLAVSYVPLPTLCDYGSGVLDGLEGQDLVCVDDLQAVVGNADWEHALFDLFNQLRDGECGFIVSATLPPDDLPVTLPDLKTRLSWGLTLLLRGISDEDKVTALSLQAQRRGLDLPPPVSRFLLSNCRRDLPGLMRLLDQLDQASLAAQRKLTIPFLKSFLANNPS